MTSMLYGKTYNTDIFVKLNGDTAFLYWFYEEHWPRRSLADTLIRSQNSLAWRTDSSEIWCEKDKYFIKFFGPYQPPQLTTTRLNSREKDDLEIELNKKMNHFLIRKYYLGYSNDSVPNASKDQLWKEVGDKYQLLQKAGHLPHADFTKVFDEFTTELETRTNKNQEK